MTQEKDVGSVLQQYAAETGVYSTEKVESDFMQVTQQVDAGDLTAGLSEALRSEQTPSFDQLIGQSFEQGDARQRAGMLNQLLDGAAPSVVDPLVESGILPDTNAVQDAAITPEQASRLSSDLVQQLALQAEQEDPGVVDKMSNLFAEDPALAKTLGGGTLGVALGKIAENR